MAEASLEGRFMGKKSNSEKYVDHPRFGDQPIASAFSFTRETIERSHWRYSSQKYFPESAIPANVELQNYSVYPRSLYVDIQERCVDCRRAFIFFALEQKYWFEQLGFWVDAHCTRCTDCRKKDQNIRRLQREYQQLQQKSLRSDEETRQLRNIALELFQLGFITNRAKIDSIR